jgi:hypothetical protein
MTKESVLNAGVIALRVSKDTYNHLSEIMKIMKMDKSEAVRYSIKLTATAFQNQLSKCDSVKKENENE